MLGVHKACASSYIVFTALCAVPAAPALIGLLITNKKPLWDVLLVCATAWLFAMFWLSRFRLEITLESVTYSSLFSRPRSIPRSEIVSAGLPRVTRRTEGPYTFVIRTRTGSELRINAKVFSMEAAKELQKIAQGRP